MSYLSVGLSVGTGLLCRRSARLKTCRVPMWPVNKSVVWLTCWTHAGGWRASLGNGPPHSWNPAAAPQCPAAVASGDPHRAATPPSATASSYIHQDQLPGHNVHRYNVMFTLVTNEFLVTRLCFTACEVMLCILCCPVHGVGNAEFASVCLRVRPSAIVLNFAVSLRLYMIFGMGIS
jgi:hypothetical protein